MILAKHPSRLFHNPSVYFLLKTFFRLVACFLLLNVWYSIDKIDIQICLAVFPNWKIISFSSSFNFLATVSLHHVPLVNYTPSEEYFRRWEKNNWRKCSRVVYERGLKSLTNEAWRIISLKLRSCVFVSSHLNIKHTRV